MATVVGKTSDKLNALFAGTVVGLSIVSGHLIYTKGDGSQVDVGVVGDTNSVTRLFYTSGAYPTRPAWALCVEWIGPTQPPNMTTKDTWVQAG
jgi:hypothetical protein